MRKYFFYLTRRQYRVITHTSPLMSHVSTVRRSPPFVRSFTVQLSSIDEVWSMFP